MRGSAVAREVSPQARDALPWKVGIVALDRAGGCDLARSEGLEPPAF
jgi:hypothetical protein